MVASGANLEPCLVKFMPDYRLVQQEYEILCKLKSIKGVISPVSLIQTGTGGLTPGCNGELFCLRSLQHTDGGCEVYCNTCCFKAEVTLAEYC